MVDLGVTLTWIVMSVASAKGLSALARLAATNDADAELAALAGEGALAHDAPGRIDTPSPLPCVRS